MSIINREDIQRIINDEWLLMDDCEGNKNCDVVKELARIALASLEAEAVAFRSKLQPPSAIGSEHWDYTDHRQPDAFELENCVIERLYTAPPAPVSVPDFGALTKCIVQRLVDYGVADDDSIASAEEFVYKACRAAMLQGADGNSPVIPDGWVLVPLEPTEDMIVNGFESEPDESFSDDKEWEEYEAMSGCQQAAHRAKLCWAAMIAAALKIDISKM